MANESMSLEPQFDKEDYIVMDGLSAILSDVMSMKASNRPTTSIIPINDIRQLETINYAKGKDIINFFVSKESQKSSKTNI